MNGELACGVNRVRGIQPNIIPRAESSQVISPTTARGLDKFDQTDLLGLVFYVRRFMSCGHGSELRSIPCIGELELRSPL